MQPYLPARPTDMNDEESYRWFFEIPGIPVPASHVSALLAEGVRRSPADARTGLCKD